jgi:hypothetical protein
VTSLGPDARASPEGVVATDRTASVVLFFDIPADKLDRFTFEAVVANPDGVTLGVAHLPFTR